jgi:hypothetical protein
MAELCWALGLELAVGITTLVLFFQNIYMYIYNNYILLLILLSKKKVKLAHGQTCMIIFICDFGCFEWDWQLFKAR